MSLNVRLMSGILMAAPTASVLWASVTIPGQALDWGSTYTIDAIVAGSIVRFNLAVCCCCRTSQEQGTGEKQGESEPKI